MEQKGFCGIACGRSLSFATALTSPSASGHYMRVARQSIAEPAFFVSPFQSSDSEKLDFVIGIPMANP